MNSEKKILLVLGASSDVGIELIKHISDNYDLILAHYCNSVHSLLKLQKEIGKKLVILQADFASNESTQAMINKIIIDMELVPSHIVHFSANRCRNVKFAKSSLKEFESGFQTSVYSLVSILMAFLPKMAKNKYGKVVVMLTSYTLNSTPKYLSPYITEKYALLGLVRSLAVEYADKGITINGVSPEMIETKFLSEIPEMVIQQNAISNPLGRNLMVGDVVPTFEYLLSDCSDCITGQNIGITCGK